MPDSKTAMSLRFPDPAQRAAIAAAAKQAGVSMQEYILSAAYDRATAVERRFLAGFQESMARSGAAFAAEPGSLDPTAEQRAAEQEAQRELGQQGRGHAA
ncbi:type II toxin -antitoxin system TacA 1-like antitoxin [Streptomyces sp. NPDC004082]|uniref:type II toxin -antitoxin system TacA 1-like antitoxin n=1 Tax=unclassified Streptomyces TaxID=2593676 RepID=UPI0033BF8E3C